MSFIDIYDSLVNSGFFNTRHTREFIRDSLDTLEKAVRNRELVIVRAPPGIGKTAISIVAGIYAVLQCGKGDFTQALHVVPTRSLVEDIYSRVSDGIKRLDIEPDLAERFVSRQYGLVHEAPFLSGAFVVSTLDTYFYNVIKLPLAEIEKIEVGVSLGHYEVPRSSVFSSLNFLDEVHMFLEEGASLEKEARSTSTFISLVKALALSGTPVVLSTATLPDVIIHYLSDSVGSSIKTRTVDYNARDSFYDTEISKQFHVLDESPCDLIKGVVKLEQPEVELAKIVANIYDGKASARREAIAVATNTISLAKRVFRELRSLGVNAVLLHSRFTPKDRIDKLRYIKESAGTVTVTTQVIEVGVDMSYDVMISELATPSSLVQRFGRLARGAKDEGWWLVYYTENTLERGSGIYNPALVAKTKEYIDRLSERIHWHLPRTHSDNAVGYLDLINSCWSDIEYTPGRDVDVERIVLDPLISSGNVLKFVEMIGNLLRDENLCSIYLMHNRDDLPGNLSDFMARRDDSLITVSCHEVASTVKKALNKHYPVMALSRIPEKNELQYEEVSKDYMSRLLIHQTSMPARNVTIALSADLYDGGVHGEGLREP